MQTRVYKVREILFNKRNELLLVRPIEFKPGQSLNRRAEKIDGAEPNVRAVVVGVQQGPECCSKNQVVAYRSHASRPANVSSLSACASLPGNPLNSRSSIIAGIVC